MSETPLFLIHLSDAAAGYGETLAQEMAPRIPVYGLSLTEYGGSIESLADRYIRSMRQIQAHGPYRIAGWSCGGLVAYEMARQLIGHDESVEFVGLLDTHTPAAFRALPAESKAELALLETQNRYCLRPVAANVMLFSAKEGGGDRSRGWSAVLGRDLRISEVPGDHTKMIRVHTADLARAMCEAIQALKSKNERPAAYEPLVVLQSPTSRNQLPIFCAPGAGASVTSFISLAGAMPGTHVVGLQPRGFDAGQMPYLSVEAAAKRCVASILAAESRGPYRLIGHSFGGWIAFEIARQLSSVQAQVAPIVLLDVDPPSPPDRRPWRHDQLAAITKLARVLERTAGTELGINKAFLEQLGCDKWLEALFSAMRSVNLLPRTASLAYVRNLMQVFTANLNTLYIPASVFTGPVLLFQTQDTDPDDDEWISPEEAAAQWRQYAPNIEVLAASGNHMTMLKAGHIEEIVQVVQRRWQRHTTC